MVESCPLDPPAELTVRCRHFFFFRRPLFGGLIVLFFYSSFLLYGEDMFGRKSLAIFGVPSYKASLFEFFVKIAMSLRRLSVLFSFGFFPFLFKVVTPWRLSLCQNKRSAQDLISAAVPPHLQFPGKVWRSVADGPTRSFFWSGVPREFNFPLSTREATSGCSLARISYVWSFLSPP